MSTPPDRPPAGALRPRRRARETREEILDAAERRLRREGPEALRLTEIAADVGISHPAILHHFGSREGLIAALVARVERDIAEDLRATLDAGLERGVDGAVDAAPFLERVLERLGDRGNARLLAWLVLSGRARSEPDPDGPLRRIAEEVHRRRCEGAAAAGAPEPAFEATLFPVLLAAHALLGEAIAGSATRARAGVEEGGGSERRYRRWFSDLVVRLLAPRSPGDR